jgi:hypothetical protein
VWIKWFQCQGHPLKVGQPQLEWLTDSVLVAGADCTRIRGSGWGDKCAGERSQSLQTLQQVCTGADWKASRRTPPAQLSGTPTDPCQRGQQRPGARKQGLVPSQEISHMHKSLSMQCTPTLTCPLSNHKCICWSRAVLCTEVTQDLYGEVTRTGKI